MLSKTRITILIIVLITLILGFGVVSAANNTDTNDLIKSEKSISNSKIINNDDIQKDIKSNDKIVTEKNKDNDKVNKSIKDAKTANENIPTFQAKNYNELYNQIVTLRNKGTTKSYIINLVKGGDFTITDTLIWGGEKSPARNLTINGNGVTINGKGTKSFLTILPSYSVTLNNLNIVNNYRNISGGAVFTNGELRVNSCNFTNCKTTGAKSDNLHGGAIRGGYDAKVYINNSIFRNNVATSGAGAIVIFTNTSKINPNINLASITPSLVISNSQFINNTAGHGGAINPEEYTSTIITNCTFTSNRATDGAAINTDYKSYIVSTNNKFISNVATKSGAALYNGVKCTMVLNNNTFSNNQALHGGAICNQEGATLTITGSTFSKNKASGSNAAGGAIHNSNNDIVTIKNSVFTDNTASTYGGAISNINNNIVNITNSTIKNSVANKHGGAIYNSDKNKVTIKNSILANNMANTNGGALFSGTSANIVVSNSTFNANKAKTNVGGAVCGGSGTTVTLANCQFNKNNASSAGGYAIFNPRQSTLVLKGSTYLNQVDQNIVNKTILTQGTLKIQTVNTKIAITSISGSSEVSVKGNLIDEYDTPVIRQNVIVKMGNFDKTVVTDNNGAYIATFSNMNPATYRVTATFNKNAVYNSATTNATYTVESSIINTKTTVATTNGVIGERLSLTANVVDANNRRVTNGYIIFKLNGITIKDNGKLTGSNNPLKVYVKDGVATTTVIADLNMRYAQNLTAVYSGSSQYNPSRSNSAKAQIQQRNASIVVSSNVKVIKQGQTLTITARVYDTTNGKMSSNLIPYEDEFVYFKVNGITLKNSAGGMLKAKVVNGVATVNYTIPLGLSGVTDGKTFNVKNHTILAGYYNKNYQAEVRNTSTFQVERSNITITISDAVVYKSNHILSLTATIKDYLGNKVLGPNKCIVKVNGATIKNGTNPIYYYSSNGVLTLNDITIPSYDDYKTIEIVTQDRLSYKSQRNTTSTIKVVE